MLEFKINPKYLLIIPMLLLINACKKEIANADRIGKSFVENQFLNKKYDEVCFLTTHNAMNAKEKGYTIPNQTFSITNQLNDGVRGLMIDTYDGGNGVALTYHTLPQGGSQNLVDVLQEIKNFLTLHTKEVITIIFENNGSNVQLIKAIDSIGLDAMTFTHTNGDEFPTMQTMVNNNQRLVLFIERDKTPKVAYLKHAWSTIFDTDYQYNNVSEFDSDINRGSAGSKELYLINHWLQKEIIAGINIPDSTLAPQANKQTIVSKRVQDCSTANNHFVNFLGVDFYHIGDAKIVVDSINGL